jgi:hypothetical protein
MRIVAIVEQTKEDPISHAALTYLPFISESIESWNSQSDIGLFVREIFSGSMTTLWPEGRRQTTRSSNPESDWIVRGQGEALGIMQAFAEASGSENLTLSAEESSAVALSLKYRLAWKALCNAVLSESAFGSLPHILEAEDDLECSIELAKRHFYKQAMQVLRAFLEGQIVDLVLARDNVAFAMWKQGNYRIPNLRGKDGLLKQLQKSGILALPMTDRIDRAYSTLNSSIHGREDMLINSGLFAGNHTGRAFRTDKLDLWSQQLGETVQIGVLLMKEKTKIWLNNLQSQWKMCEVCREQTLEKSILFVFGGEEFARSSCRICKHEQTFSSASRQRVYLITELRT